MTSTVKSWDTKKGFGFLFNPDREARRDVFVHHRNIVGTGRKNLTPGQRVVFDLETTPKGDAAVNVRPKESFPHRD